MNIINKIILFLSCVALVCIPLYDFSTDSHNGYSIKGHHNSTSYETYPVEIRGTYSCYGSFYIYIGGTAFWILLTLYELYELFENKEEIEYEIGDDQLKLIERENWKTGLMICSGSLYLLMYLLWSNCMKEFHYDTGEIVTHHWNYYMYLLLTLCINTLGLYRFFKHNVVVTGDNIIIQAYKNKEDLYSRV